MAGHEKKKKTASCWRYRKTDADCCPRFHRPALVEGSAQVHRPLVRRRPVRRVHAYRPQRQYCHRLVRRHFARPSGRTHISAHFVLEYHTPGRCAAWASAGRQSRPPPQVVLSPPMLITFATALEGVRAWPPCRCPTCVGLLARQAYRASVVGLLFLSLNKL